MTFDFLSMIPSIPFIASGAFVTLSYAGISILLGLVLGTVLALVKLSGITILRVFSQGYTSVFRGTPLLVQLSLIYFATPQLIGYKISAFEAGVLAFSLNSAAYVSEIIRGGIQAVDKGQTEAALSLGIPYLWVMIDIVLPQAIRTILPALVNEMIDLVKESALVSIIGEADLLRRANIIAAEKYIYFEPLLVAAVMYYIIVMILSWFARKLENNLQKC